MEVRMSEAAAHFRARLLGLCVLVLGTCIFVINGVNLGAAFDVAGHRAVMFIILGMVCVAGFVMIF